MYITAEARNLGKGTTDTQQRSVCGNIRGENQVNEQRVALQSRSIEAVTISDLCTSASIEWKDFLYIYSFNLSKDINNRVIP
jgi:hypothetical protein